MQPPSEPHAAGSATPAHARLDVAALYRRYHHDLLRTVAHAVTAPHELIEDACQTAWTIMLRRQPNPATAFAWLRIVAIHEAFRHCALARNEKPVGDFRSPDAGELAPGEHPEPATGPRDLADQVAAREQNDQRLADLGAINPRDAQALYLKGLGYSYQEIMQITGASYTAVNRRITEGRRALRKLECQR